MRGPNRILFALLLASCAEASGNGTTLCSPDKGCPPGRYCAVDERCWDDNTGPGRVDGGPAAGADAGPDSGVNPGRDGGNDPRAAPPSVYWISGGGGYSVSPSGDQLGYSIGGSIVCGSDGTVTFGALSTSIY